MVWSLSLRQFGKKSTLLALITIFILGSIIYSTSLEFGYFLDDHRQVVGNKMIHDLSNWKDSFGSSTMADANGGDSLGGIYYKPIMMLSYSVLWAFGDGDPFSFRVFQLFLHCLNAFLIFLLLRPYFKKEISAFAVGLLFLCHPINSEAVLFIADLQEPLYVFFGLLALLLTASSSSRYRFLVVGILLLCSLLSKESGFLFILTGSILSFIFRRKDFKFFVSTSALVLLIYFGLRFGVAQLSALHSDNTQIARASLMLRIMTMPRALIHYIHLYLFPKDIALTQDWVQKDLSLFGFWIPLFEVLLLVGLIFFYFFKSKDKAFLFFLLWFGLGWGLHSQLIPLDGTVSDRWFYFTGIGFTAMFFKFIENTFNFQLRTAVLSLIVLTIPLSLRSYTRSLDWRNDLTLYEHDVKVDPESFYLNNNLGLALLSRGRFNEARQYIEKTKEVSEPGSYAWLVANRNLGAIELDLKNYPKAEQYFRISIKDNSVQSYRGLAAALQGQQRYQEVRQFLITEGLVKFPEDYLLQKVLAETPNQ